MFTEGKMYREKQKQIQHKMIGVFIVALCVFFKEASFATSHMGWGMCSFKSCIQS